MNPRTPGHRSVSHSFHDADKNPNYKSGNYSVILVSPNFKSSSINFN